MSSFSVGTGRLLAGQSDMIALPSGPPIYRYAILLFHGATGHGYDWYSDTNSPNGTTLVRSLTDCGAVVISTDWGGDQWGNATANGYIEAVRGQVGAFGCDTSKVVLCGGSMGGLEVWQYILNYSNRVAGAVLIAPAADLNGLYTANTLGLQASIASAWGVTAPAPLPSSADPLSNAVAIANTKVPHTVYYSTGDTVITESSLKTMSAAIPTLNLVKVSTTAGHGDGETGAAIPLGLPSVLLSAAV